MGLSYSWIDYANSDILDILVKEYHKNKISLNELIKLYIDTKLNKNEMIYGK